jgi:hypothetical protein
MKCGVVGLLDDLETKERDPAAMILLGEVARPTG